MKITTIELVALADAAKALKQKDFIIYNQFIFGLDNKDYIAYCDNININELSIYDGLIFNYRELSAFIKTIATETEFDINFDFGEECMIKTFMDGVLTVKRNKRLLQDASHKYYLYSLSNNQCNQIDITNDLLDLFSMKKTDGCFFYKPIINNKQYFMTLFSGLLPLNKSDRISLYIDDFTDHFISHFIVIKKKYKVHVIVCYMKV